VERETDLAWAEVIPEAGRPWRRLLRLDDAHVPPDTLPQLAERVKVRDAAGRLLSSTGGFTAGDAHGLFDAFQQPSTRPVRELVRLGRLAILDPGASRPLFASWRLSPQSREPVRIDYGSGALSVPVATRPAAR